MNRNTDQPNGIEIQNFECTTCNCITNEMAGVAQLFLNIPLTINMCSYPILCENKIPS